MSSLGREGTGRLCGLRDRKAILARAGASPQLREGGVEGGRWRRAGVPRGRAGPDVGRGDEVQGVAVAAGLR